MIGREIRLFDGSTLNGWHAVPRTPVARWPGQPAPPLVPGMEERVLPHRGR